jgi:hypothetical protein
MRLNAPVGCEQFRVETNLKTQVILYPKRGSTGRSPILAVWCISFKYPSDLMEMWPVSLPVNKVRNDSADMIAPVEDAPNTDL